MRLKPTAARRLLLLGVIVLALIVCAVAFVGVRSWQRERQAQRLRTDGLAAYHKQDYYGTLDNLGRLLRRKPGDREAWLAFADAREHIEESGGQHFKQAIGAYSRALALDESDTVVAYKLLKLYNTVGYYTEAKDLALRLRPKNPAEAGPEQADVLCEEAIARLSLKDYGESLDAITQRLMSLRPGVYQPAYLRSSFLLNAARRSDALALVDDLVKAHPSEAPLAFLRVMIRAGAGADTDPKAITAAVCKVAGLSVERPERIEEAAYTEPELAAQLMSTFDRLNLHMHSLLVLKDSAQRLHNPDAQRAYARRAWQMALAADVVATFAPAGADISKLNPDILGFLALSRKDLNQKPEALDILKRLRADDRGYLGRAWSSLLSALLEKSDPFEGLTLIESAIKEHATEPVLLYFRGEMLARLGRVDEARDAWAGVYKSSAAEGWAVPQVRIAETLLDEGRLESGATAATEAVRKSSTSAAANLVMLRAQTAMVEAGRIPAKPDEALKQLEEIGRRVTQGPQSGFAETVDRLTLPSRVSLLCALDRRPDAIAAIDALIAKPEGLTPELASRLASVSIRTGLKVEDRLLAAAASGSGAASPETLFSRAVLLETAGRREDAKRLVDDSVAAAKPDDLIGLSTARAQFYDAIADPRTLDIWKKLLSDFPNSLPLHISALRSTAIAADPALVEQVVTRVTALGGSDADKPTHDVRFARSRALLHGKPSPKDRDQAIALLRALVLEAPARLEFRGALIEALLMDDPSQKISPDLQAAAEQLTAAAASAPNRAPYIFRLALILQQLGRTGDAASELSKLALDVTAARSDRLAAVDRLMALSYSYADPALKAVESMLASDKEPSAELLIRRGVLLASLRRDREAVDSYRRAVDLPIQNPDAIVTAANGLRALGDKPSADRMVAKLDEPGISPVTKALALGAIAAAARDTQTARREFTRATEIAPDDPRAWSALARFCLQQGDLPAAEAAAQSGLQRLPGNPDLTVALQQVRLAGQTDSTADLTAFADALDKTPGMQRRAAALRAIEKAKSSGSLGDAAMLVRLADEFADDSTTQLFIARRLCSLKPPRFDKAAAVLTPAVNRFSSDAALQEQATQVFATVGDWERARVAATAWRALTRSTNADIAVAEAQLALGNPRAALDAISELRLPPTIDDSDRFSLGVLNVRVRAQAALKDTTPAAQTLQPYLASRIVRREIALPAAAEVVAPVEAAIRWIEQVAAAAKADDPEEQFRIAAAWSRLAERFPTARADLLKRTMSILDALAASEATATSQVFEARAAILDTLGDAPGALAAARQAVAKDPNSVSALLGLAARLLAGSSDPAEAIAIARKAVETAPKLPGPLVLLAQAQQKQALARAAAGDHGGRDAARKEALHTLQLVSALDCSSFEPLTKAAAVAEVLEDVPAAIALYEEAVRSAAGSPPRDVAIVKNNLAFAIYSQAVAGGSRDQLQRAKTLIDEALRVRELSDFYDTLGAIDAALGDRTGAIAAYRKSLSLDPKAVASSIGLAHALADGAADEKAEASRLIKTAADAVTSGAAISPERTRQLEQTRQKLAVR